MTYVYQYTLDYLNDDATFNEMDDENSAEPTGWKKIIIYIIGFLINQNYIIFIYIIGEKKKENLINIMY